MENGQIARLLSETADMMEIACEDGFRIRSFRNAASSIEGYPERVADILNDPARKVTDIPGVGKGIAGVIADLLGRGSFEQRDKLLAKYPASALELLKIQGLGPKSIAVLIEHHQVATVDDLERLCREQKLRTMPRMGAKLEEKVLRSIEQYRNTAGRYLLSFGKRMADELSQMLTSVQGVEQVVAAGSLRRGKETIGDLDLMVVAAEPEPVLDHFVKFPKVHEVLAKGPNKASARIGLEGLQVDVRVLPKETLGAALQYFTGSKEHNVNLRSRCLKMGYTLSEYGLFRLDTEERVAGETEEEIYERLGLAYIPPELRENQGEIEAAEQRRLPHLIEARAIRGDLHMHTVATDGRATLEEMAEAARERGYEYIAITDHSKAIAMSNGLDEARVVEFAREVREINGRGLGIHIFSGLECDIRKDGTMDIEDDALAELDMVIGSIHSHMNLEPAEMTSRLMRALECPHLTLLGHPTGRLLLQREGYGYDFDKVATEAARRRVWMEINASPERLDLHAPLIRAAKSKGVRFTIDTDAHRPSHLLNMPYGVVMARRGWLQAADVMNTLPLEEFKIALQQRKN